MADVAAHPTMSTAVAVNLRLPTPRATAELGRRLAMLLRRGDLVLLTGDLGAGKTTLAQGIGEGLRVRGPVTSPTFVIARVHPSLAGGPDLVHVDAYRLGTTMEMDDLDLDADLDHSVVVVEWGRGIAEALSSDRLEVMLEGRTQRTARLVGIGPRWNHPAAAGALRSLLGGPLA